jgi:hypothetical protein
MELMGKRHPDVQAMWEGMMAGWKVSGLDGDISLEKTLELRPMVNEMIG